MRNKLMLICLLTCFMLPGNAGIDKEKTLGAGTFVLVNFKDGNGNPILEWGKIVYDDIPEAVIWTIK